MKTTIIICLLAIFSNSYGQVIKENEREDGTYEYWFTLDDFKKPVQFPLHVEHIDGTTVKISGDTPLNGKKATLLITDLQTHKTDTIYIPDDGKFELLTGKQINLYFELSGFSSYEKGEIGLDNLSMLVLKMYYLPDDDIYLLHTRKAISQSDLKSFMRCVYETKNSGGELNSCTHPEFLHLEIR